MEKRKTTNHNKLYKNNNIHSNEDLLKHNQTINDANQSIILEYINFKYSTLLFISLLPSLIVILAFGGRPTLLVLSFGTIATYIFDLLGSLEGSILSVIVTLITIWGTLIYASIDLLSETLMNFAIIIIMGITLFILFLLISAQYQTMINEMKSLFMYVESLLFTSIPLLSSVLLTWFLSTEIPFIDVSICFNIIYYIYLLILSYPRIPSFINYSNRFNTSNINILSTTVVIFQYILPLLISPLLYVSLHHHIILKTYRYLVPLLVSVVIPVLFISICIDQQHKYFHKLISYNTLKFNNSFMQLISSATFISCIQSYSFFDDIKSLAYKKQGLISFAICLCSFTIAFMLCIQKIIENLYNENVDGYHNSNQSYITILELCIKFLVGLACLLLVVILHLPTHVMPIAAIGGIGLATYYSSKSIKTITSIILVVWGAWTGMIIYHYFLSQTLSHLSLELTWYLESIPLSIKRLCFISTILVGLSIIIPTVGSNLLTKKNQSDDYGLLPSTNSINTNNNYIYLQYVFEFLYQLIPTIIAILELMIREQDWFGDLGIEVESVYPSYLLFSTAALASYTAYHAYLIDIMRLPAVWIVWLSQSIKLLHLLGLPTNITSSIGALSYAFLSPFFNMYYLYDNDINAIPNNNRFKLHPVQMFLHISQVCISLSWCYIYVANDMYIYLFYREPFQSQLLTGCLALLCGFISVYSLIFLPNFSTLRSYVTVLGLLLVIPATGNFNISYDPTSTYYLTIQSNNSNGQTLSNDLISDEHMSGVYLILSAAIICSAILDILPIKKSIYRLIFLLSFSCSFTKAILTITYPLTLSTTIQFSHSVFQFPFIHTFVTVLLSTSTSLHTTLPKVKVNETSLRIYQFVILWILLGILFNIYLSKYDVIDGILLTTLLTSSLVTLITKFFELYNDINYPKAIVSNNSSNISVICAMATLAAIASSICLSIYSSHSFIIRYNDFIVPLTSLLFITTKRNIFVSSCHPIELSLLLSITYWFLHGFYLIFIYGYNLPSNSTSIILNFGMFQNNNLSIWSNEIPIWLSLLNFLMLLIPLPAITLSFQYNYNNSNINEEILLFLAILCLIPLIGSYASSIRLLGGFGTVYTSFRCYDISIGNHESNRII